MFVAGRRVAVGIVGAGVKVTVIWSVTPVQVPFPVVVNVSVSVPPASSVAVGV